AGHADPLEHARRRRGGADRARLADVVRAVRHRATAEVVPLDRACEALADADAGDFDLVAGLERLDGHGLADGQLRGTAELDHVAVRRGAGLLQVPDLALRQLALGPLVEGELQGLVAVRVVRAHVRDRAGARLDHRDGRELPALGVEDLRHAQLATENAFHLRSPPVQIASAIGENRASPGRRERSYPERTGATEDDATRRFAAATRIRAVRVVSAVKA